jgi:hypothetical protein
MHAPNPPWARRTLIGLSRRGPQVNQNLQPRAFHRGIPSRSAGHGMTRAQPPPAAHQHNIFFSPRNPLCPNHLPRQHPPAASLNPPTSVVTWNQGGKPHSWLESRTGQFWPAFSLSGRITLLLSINASDQAGQNWPVHSNWGPDGQTRNPHRPPAVLDLGRLLGQHRAFRASDTLLRSPSGRGPPALNLTPMPRSGCPLGRSPLDPLLAPRIRACVTATRVRPTISRRRPPPRLPYPSDSTGAGRLAGTPRTRSHQCCNRSK